MAKQVLGVIGGSGVYDLPGLENARWETVESPWGEPSDQLRRGEINGLPLVFLPRHGRGHRYSPSDIPYQANIDVMKRAGVTTLISLSACGSFRETMPPGTFALVDQFIDRTFARPKSFFGKGCVGHVGFAHPVSPLVFGYLRDALRSQSIAHALGGTYLCMEGPQFSTLAESRLYRDVWGCDIIGMTGMPEAKLAREAEIPYAMVAMVTDFDCWHPDHDHVDVASVVAVMRSNVETARRLIVGLAALLPRETEACPLGSDRSLDHAIMTAPAMRDPLLVAKLDAVAGRVLNPT